MSVIQRQLEEIKKESEHITFELCKALLYLNEKQNSFLLMFGLDCRTQGIYLLDIFVTNGRAWIKQTNETLKEIQLKLEEKLKLKEEK